MTTTAENRDQIIRKLWCIFRDLSDEIEADDFTEEDLDLWQKVTQHSAVQNAIRMRYDHNSGKD